MAVTAASFPSSSTSASEDELEDEEDEEGRIVERLSGPLSRNTSVNHDFIADNFTRSRARRDRRRVDDDESWRRGLPYACNRATCSKNAARSLAN